MGSFFVSNFEMKTLSAICFLGYVAAQGAMAPPWVPPTVGLWRMMFTTIIDPTHRTDIGGSDQTSEDIDTVMDAKGWPKCTDDDRWAEEFPWNKDKNMNKCRWAKEWDEYRHYLFTKAALDVCDGTVTQWHPDFAAPPQFAAQGFACSYCYKTQNDACTIDGGYAEAQFAGPAAAPDTDLWFQNAPRNLAECTGTPPVCPGNPPIGHEGDFPTTTAATTTTTTTATTTAAPTTTVAATTTANTTTTAATDSSALVAGASLLFMALL